ncbi:hypothetical protein BsWGS_04394 [Bradybaena similaris]
MEFFGFACGNQAAAASFPFSTEAVLKGYPDHLKEHPSFLSVPFSSYDFTPLDLSSLYQGVVDSYYSALHAPMARSIGAGIVAAAIIYCTWKVTVTWNSTLSTSNADVGLESNKAKKMKGAEGSKPKNRSKAASNKPTDISPAKRAASRKTNADTVVAAEPKSVGIELAAVSENFQRQLLDALSRLDDVRFRLKELESERELLNAEIELRKKITQRLHVENSSEREKRQQAELKMEMMEIENSQLRQLRRELSLKVNQVEKLEKFIKEKDGLQMKLFEENVVLPRAVAEARAKEFGTLQSRVHQLQLEVNATKRLLESHPGCHPTKSVSSVLPNDMPMLKDAPSTSTAPPSPKMNILSETAVVLPGYTSRGAKTKRNQHERSPPLSRSHVKLVDASPRVTRSRTSPELHLSNKARYRKNYDNKEAYVIKEMKQVSNTNIPSTTSLNKIEDHGNSFDTAANKNVGVFAHLKAFISGFRDGSSESEFSNPQEPAPCLKEQHISMRREPKGSGENEDYPLSDEQSSVFMSASGGSVTSDTDRREDPTRAANRSSKKKMLCVKRFSKFNRFRQREKDKIPRRKLACHLIPGDTSIEDALDAVSDSSDWSHRSTLKNFPIATKPGRNSPLCSKCSGSSNDGVVSAMESSEENSADSGESWIVITPANS